MADDPAFIYAASYDTAGHARPDDAMELGEAPGEADAKELEAGDRRR